MTPILGGPVEKFETLSYAPGLQGGTDLEAATKTISATSEQAGADYTTIHTIVAPADARIAVLRGCMRLTVTIDSWAGGGVQLNARVKRGGASVWTGVLAVAAATGQKIISWDITTLITGAQTNTLFLWVDAGTCVISEVTMWTGVGTNQSALNTPVLSLTHTGKYTITGFSAVQGTGTYSFTSSHNNPRIAGDNQFLVAGIGAFLWGASSVIVMPRLSPGVVYFYFYTPSVATDLLYISSIFATLRSQQ